MVSQIHPTAEPRVVGVSNEATLGAELTEQGVDTLRSGQISGLNGVTLAAAADLGLEAFCLLGEIPFYAISVPNPKASMAVLRVFGRMAGVRIGLAPLERQARSLERRLVDLLERMNIDGDDPTSTELLGEASIEEFGLPDFMLESGDDISDEESRRIETLFRAAEADRRKAVDLKNELDRLGAFRAYEDRFLDLFRRR